MPLRRSNFLRRIFTRKARIIATLRKIPPVEFKLSERAVEQVGGQLVFTDEIVFSSSSLLNRHTSNLPKEAADFIATFKSRHSSGQVLGYLERAKSLKVLVIGEAIIDEYHYCQTLGKSGKEPILAVRFMSSEKFAGGIMAVANHVASFCDHPSMYTFLGQEDSHEDFIRSKLSPKVVPTFFDMAGADDRQAPIRGKLSLPEDVRGLHHGRRRIGAVHRREFLPLA